MSAILSSTMYTSCVAYAWSVISFVATVGGNLTITGSAGYQIYSKQKFTPQSPLHALIEILFFNSMNSKHNRS